MWKFISFLFGLFFQSNTSGEKKDFLKKVFRAWAKGSLEGLQSISWSGDMEMIGRIVNFHINSFKPDEISLMMEVAEELDPSLMERVRKKRQEVLCAGEPLLGDENKEIVFLFHCYTLLDSLE